MHTRLLLRYPKPLDPAATEDLAVGFKALGDPTRLAMVRLVVAAGEPVCVVDVERHFDFAQSTISYHLQTLVDAGVFSRERRGKWSYYSLVPARLDELGSSLGALASVTSALA